MARKDGDTPGQGEAPGDAGRRRGIRLTAALLALLAIGFYLAFILVTGASN